MGWKLQSTTDKRPLQPEFKIGDTVMMKRWRFGYWNLYEVIGAFYVDCCVPWAPFAPAWRYTLRHNKHRRRYLAWAYQMIRVCTWPQND